MKKLVIAVIAAMAAGAAQAQQAPPANQTDTGDAQKAAALNGLTEIVVTGSRVSHTVENSPAPIDVVTPEALQSTGATDVQQALTFTLPSFTTNLSGGQDVASQVRSISLRGLAPDQTLVLVNGIRRHNSALVNVSAAIGNGAEPVDLDMIPQSAIDHIEVLRDGAAAQYGSDAIAGVINIILKSNDHGGTASVEGGAQYKQDGIFGEGLVDMGAKLGDGGFVNLSADLRSQGETNRNGNNAGSCIWFAGDPRCRQYPPPQIIKGNEKSNNFKFGYNLDYPVSTDADLYSFGTFAHRESVGWENYRTPASDNTVRALDPNGYEPLLDIDETDFQVAAGMRGPSFLGWSWDLSSTYGYDNANLSIDNSLNPSLGVHSPQNFHAGNFVYGQWTNNLEFNRDLTPGFLPAPLHTTVGFEYRLEEFQIQAGDPAGYENGPYPVLDGPDAGTILAGGTQGFGTFRPQDATDQSRDNVSAYVDFETSLTPQWLVGLAGRFENYSDFGSAESGKFTTRYDLNKELGFRATVSNGFRAPSLGQEFYATSTTNFVNTVPVDIRELPVGSPAAVALGAKPLKAETSNNYSVGIIATPMPKLHATIDAYQIDIDNRIVQTGLLIGPGVDAILAKAGITGIDGVQYYENAIDTHTLGVDIMTDYTTDFDQYGTVRWSVAFNLNRTNITNIAENPTQLAAAGSNLFDRQSQEEITSAVPKSKVIIGADWFVDAFSVSLHQTRYGGFTEPTSADEPVYFDDHQPPVWITDLELGYDVTDAFHVAVGANNLFDTYGANSNPENANPAGGPNPRNGDVPWGAAGGFYYARLSYRW